MKNIACAVDLGSTTIDSCLFEIDSGRVVAENSKKNRQSLYGSDVINRILNASRSKEIREKLTDIVRTQLKEMLFESLDASGLDISCIERICISGNTTMISLLLGMDVASMGVAPFNHELKDSVTALYEGITVYLTGCVSAFIGGDILSGIAYLEHNDDKPFSSDKNVFFIDLGTNGEMILNAGGKLYACSTACGPAFEGCTRKQGVYGSSVIDVIAMLIKAKRITGEGVIEEPFFDTGIDVNNIHIDMDILRSILMAKSAIYTGIITLARRAGIQVCDIEKIYIAGGFGFYLNLDNAMYIGLLPKEFKGKISVVGNTSLKGAMDIIKNDSVKELDAYANGRIKLISLAEDEDYKTGLINNMIFGE